MIDVTVDVAADPMGLLVRSALSRFGVMYIMTHDSIGLGEDGPTHQPVEVLELVRATPNINAFRPADGNEVTRLPV